LESLLKKKQQQPPHLTEPQMIKAVAHATRVHLLTVLNERAASPRELAAELERPLRHACYHLEKLEELGCVELVETKEVWGGRTTEHFYRALQRPWFDREAWKQVDPKDQPGVTSSIMAHINEDIAVAIKAGTLNGENNHISRTPMVVDEESYEELVELMNSTLEEAVAIQERATNRLEAGGKSILTKVHLIQFESPAPGSRPVR
jgi:predicted ArsR family transcriptional regulator